MSQSEKAEAKANNLAKQASSLEQQLGEAQDLVREETRQKLQLQSRLRQAEDDAITAKDQVESMEQTNRIMDGKIISLSTQVRLQTHRLKHFVVLSDHVELYEIVNGLNLKSIYLCAHFISFWDEIYKIM